MNLPNKLTVVRMGLVPLILLCLLLDDERLGHGTMALGWLLALALFIAAAITDWLDGAIARRRQMITNFGRLMDPLADKLLIMSCFVAFVEKNIFPAWMVIIILLREFFVTGLRSLGTERGIVIQADKWGKSKTITQMVTVIAVMALKSARYFLMWIEQWKPLVEWTGPVDDYIGWLLHALAFLCVILSVGSGTLYLIRNRALFRDN